MKYKFKLIKIEAKKNPLKHCFQVLLIGLESDDSLKLYKNEFF